LRDYPIGDGIKEIVVGVCGGCGFGGIGDTFSDFGGQFFFDFANFLVQILFVDFTLDQILTTSVTPL